MSIKQSIASLVILLSVSFSALGATETYYSVYGSQLCGGTTIRAGSIDALGAKWASSHNCVSETVKPCTYSRYKYNQWDQKLYCTAQNGLDYYVDFETVRVQCADGQVIDEQTGRCTDPTPFCERSDTINQMNQFKDACFDKGWNPMVSCTDSTESLEMSCNPPPEPDECTPDSSDWPACKDDEPKQCTPDSPDYPNCCDASNNWCDNPPTDDSCTIFSDNYPECAGDVDVDPPTGGDLGDPDKPSGGGTGNPDPDKPEPDVDNTSDTLAAIKSMNSDLNAQLTGINNDMNKNQAETKSALDALKASVDLNTDTVVDNANHVANAIQGQSDMLSDIGNNTNRLLTSANNQLSNGFGQLSSDLGDLQQTNQQGFDELSDKLDDLKPCVPTPENRFCESPHGVDSNFVGDALTQADSIVSGALGSYESTVVGAANDLLEKNITAESEAHITAVSDSFLNLLPQPSECMRLSLPTLNGGNVSISCEFSHKLKMILSILIYIYTIKTLVEILLTEVTPVPSNKPGSGRYY
ncbi:chemotaxis protein [Vibrio parahaemolyticus]|uniref:chemotaxis protein n=1 Tax=Vibrio parahaemolyticus TaxID=670 RepID=UPI00111FBC92|nr:chemotaxis protein [Vibrio parahaemolyticus]EID4330753.1 chemotaxis protein [Vibrio parahaemolyticus]TOI32342.1 chemotaxis protein [Vibrio parahaemolyticus]HBC3429430.1 chemotaxis protein [Vibrio parahaemolyticus]HCG5573597.1 chemotaxis protein [Vibrio parahaemolyticus]